MQLGSDNIYYLKGSFKRAGSTKERYVDYICFKSNGQLVKTFVLATRYVPCYNFKTKEEALVALNYITDHIKNHSNYDSFEINILEETMSLYEIWKGYFI